ncbi:MAG: DUF3810 domain-containing protein [Clostridiales bacterium]|nr:DUF3810 domain-containing protein [Clostridiales bacterium]
MGEKIWKNAHKNKDGASAEFGSEEQGKNLRGRRKGTEGRLLLASGILFAVSLLLQLLARLVPGFGEWYAVTVYPVIVGTLGRVSGSVPFSVVEAAAYLLTAAAVWDTAVHLKRIRMVLVRALLFLTGIFFLFTCNCGVNYYRKPFSSYSNLEVRNSSKEELIDLCTTLTETVNQYCEDGVGAAMELKDANREGVAAMRRLGEQYPQLAGYYPGPKPLAWSYFFSVQQLCGQYSPFTVEANYNREMPDYNIPHTICHELSHLRGFMREDEANFIGYLACIGFDSPSYRYSGYLTGWVYATNALAKTDMEAYLELCGVLDERAWADLRENNEFWARYDGKAAEVSNQLNDTYLKINSQTDGVKSYGRVVDLMLAYARKQAD